MNREIFKLKESIERQIFTVLSLESAYGNKLVAKKRERRKEEKEKF